MSDSCDPVDCSLAGSSVHGIFQARMLEWFAVSFIRGSSQPRDQTQDSCMVGRCFIVGTTRDVSKEAIVVKYFAEFLAYS